MNVWHVYKGEPTAFTQSNMHDIALFFEWAWQYGSLASVQCTDVSLMQVRATDLTSRQAYQDIRNVPHDVQPGQLTGVTLPGGSTVAVQLKTGLRRRGGQGRIFLPGLPSQYVLGNVINSSYLADVRTQFVNVWNGVDEQYGPFSLVVLSRYLDNVKRAEGVPLAIVDIPDIDPLVDSQRDRLTSHKRQRRRP